MPARSGKRSAGGCDPIRGDGPAAKAGDEEGPARLDPLFDKLTAKATLGIENHLFFQTYRGGEYLSFPFLTDEAGQHTFFLVGGGYYHFEGRDQFTFLLHLNFVNPATGLGDDPDAKRGEGPAPMMTTPGDGGEPDRPRSSRLGRWLRGRGRR